MIDDLRSLLRYTVGPSVELVTVFEQEHLYARVDPAQLENVLLNLAVNACDAIPEGGQITIHSSSLFVMDDESLTENDPAPGGYIRIMVRDNGAGIPAEIINYIFDPFFTTKEVGKGTDLELSMVFGFTKQSGGHISISSEIGKGSTVTLLLPNADQD